MKDTSTWVAEPHMGDEAVRKGTGRDWYEWLDVLDAWGARERAHPEIARYVGEEHGIDGWWAQTVTVGYERIRGMRKVNERPDGFSMNASKTVPLPVDTLFELFTDDGRRAAWLGDDVLRLRTSVPPKSARFDILDDGGILAVTFIDKGERSAAQLQVEKIPTEDELARRRSIWKSRLDDLVASVSTSS